MIVLDTNLRSEIMKPELEPQVPADLLPTGLQPDDRDHPEATSFRTMRV